MERARLVKGNDDDDDPSLMNLGTKDCFILLKMVCMIHVDSAELVCCIFCKMCTISSFNFRTFLKFGHVLFGILHYYPTFCNLDVIIFQHTIL